MPKRVTPLTDLQVRNAKKQVKPYKLADGGGLCLEATPAATKLWRLKYRQLNGKEIKLHFGAYADVSLSVARERRDAARTLLGAGIDPGQARDADARQARSVSEQVDNRKLPRIFCTDLKLICSRYSANCRSPM